MVLLNCTQQEVLASSVRHATTFWQRLRGLLGSDSLPHDSALVIHNCKAIHTVGMKYAIDVVFADCEGRVIKVLSNIKPQRFSPVVKGAYYAIELPAGTIKRTGTQVGDVLEVTSCES